MLMETLMAVMVIISFPVVCSTTSVSKRHIVHSGARPISNQSNSYHNIHAGREASTLQQSTDDVHVKSALTKSTREILESYSVQQQIEHIDDITSSIVESTNESKKHTLLQGHFEFALELYGSLYKNCDRQENIVFSPVMIAASLTPFIIAADERERATHGTAQRVPNRDKLIAQQLRSVLHYSNTSHDGLIKLQQDLQECLSSSYYSSTLRYCSHYFRQQQHQHHQNQHHHHHQHQHQYQHAVHQMHHPMFAGKIIPVDFNNNVSGAMTVINRWALARSDGRLRRLLAAPPAAQTRTLAAGGAFLSTTWLENFNTSLTFDKGLFYTTASQRLEIPVVVGRQLVPLGYSRALETRVLELPLHRRLASLFLLLPDNAQHGLARLEANLTTETIRTLLVTLQTEVVNIRLPRFMVDSTPPLKAALQGMGVTELFKHSDEEPEGETLVLTDIIYKTILEVQEKGRYEMCDASPVLGEAATAQKKGSGPRSPITTPRQHHHRGTFGEKHFQVDHPFIFFLWDYIRSYVIYMGRVMEPTPILKPVYFSAGNSKRPPR